ncbi:MAG: SseB family protein [Eubacterium sp.]|nr:SseB family protein [Eubacterium sp.]MCM1213671.1 SseB family protein [Lachnospiraceae bacterium]MCM1237792.1 SseB family protein [Lachnospiraceae bacterium]MCM1345449.1 SseB family protein [Muribaculaceae bacterium]
MEFNKPVSNPMLVGCIELLREEDTPEHRNMFVTEMTKASFLAPALIDPEPEENAEGKLTIKGNSKVQFPMLSAPDGKKFFMAFTDASEYGKWQEKARPLPTFALKFDDYVAMLFHKNSDGSTSQALGFVINPVGCNIIVPKEMIANIMAARVAAARQQAAKQQGTPVPPTADR